MRQTYDLRHFESENNEQCLKMEKSQECRHSIRRSCRIGKILQISNFWFEAAAPSSALTAARHYGFWEGPSLDRKLAPVIEK